MSEMGCFFSFSNLVSSWLVCFPNHVDRFINCYYYGIGVIVYAKE